MTLHHELGDALLPAVQEAGAVILKHRAAGVAREEKQDRSPVSQADRDAEDIVVSVLEKRFPEIPIIAEERVSIDGFDAEALAAERRFFLVDALDGTRDYLNGGSDFTVNVALIDDRAPVFGMIFAPELRHAYLTLSTDQAVESWLDPSGPAQTLASFEPRACAVRALPADGATVVASKSHLDDATRAYIDGLQVATFKQAGSSLKLCLVARGVADIYPRFGPTMEWDIAAGHALLLAAGGKLTQPDGTPFLYGKLNTGLKNGPFVARGG